MHPAETKAQEDLVLAKAHAVKVCESININQDESIFQSFHLPQSSRAEHQLHFSLRMNARARNMSHAQKMFCCHHRSC